MQELMPGDPAVIGPYRLTARLGEGGMGQVFLGQSVSGRRVAVKVVRPQLAADPGFRQRFRREIEAARAVGGFWTAPVVDSDPEAREPWVASAYIEAPDLGQSVTERGVLGESELRSLAVGLAEALEAIHRAGLVHRDLKPSNVLVTGEGPRVIDFGISKAAEGGTTLTGTGLVIGTPGFMSPEQASGAQVGPPSDIFSLGAVLAFAATGEGPFGVGSVPALLYRVVHDQPGLDGVPAGSRDLMSACLTKDPKRRPSAAELLELFSADGGNGPRGDDGGAAPTRARAAAVATRVAAEGGVPGGAGVPRRVEVRTTLARMPGEEKKGWGYESTALALGLGSVVIAVGGAGFTVGPILGIIGAAVLWVVGHLMREREPSPESAVWVDSLGCGFAYRGRSWNTSWDDVEAFELELRPGAGSEVRAVVSVTPKPGRAGPAVFKEPGRRGVIVTALPYPGPEEAQPDLERLDEAVRHSAPGKYRRHPSVHRLLGR